MRFPLNSVSKGSVLKAIKRFDELGQEEFLNRHGYKKATKYELVHDGKRYDSKAILGVAYVIEHPEEDFADGLNGGGQTTEPLRKLGFEIIKTTKPETTEPPAGAARNRNPDWTKDEVILALELYFRVSPLTTSETNPEVIALSDLLNRLRIHTDRSDAGTFRNPNGVYMKLCNLLRFDPGYKGVG